MQNSTCSICDIPIVENHCSRCGQRISRKPTTIVSLMEDFVANFFSLEKSGFATIFKILFNPKKIVDNYFNGFKNYYSSPGKILIYGIAIVALHITFVDQKIMGLTIEAQDINTQYLFWLFLFPLLLISSYISFIKIEKGLSRHLISITYVASSLFIILTILNDILILIWGDILGIGTFVLFILFVFIWNSRVLTQKRKFLYFVLNTFIQISIFIGIISLIIFAIKSKSIT